MNSSKSSSILGTLNNQSQNDNDGVLHQRKRKRPSYVCTNCKKRKVKCDKQLPCNNCVKANIATTCVFSKTPSAKATTNEPPRKKLSNATEENPTYQTTKCHSQPKSKPVTDIEKEMEFLKSKILEMEVLLKVQSDYHVNSSHRRVETSRPQSLLDIKLESLKRNLITKKPGRVSYYGAFTSLTTCASNLSMRTLLVFASFFDKERNAYKLVHGKAPYIPALINATVDENEFIKRVELELLPIVEVLSQRSLYFGSRLNDLLYNGFVDMPHVSELFILNIPT
ncbi:unnamed protein product [Ambrosiozyma monospora]|uniref:Unnamed protein product n=1 Tax=Ambrosiozyma monospora TaxID=43982 RepID=A0ACB5T848_AMBMO|nr:unnamed protein product [Ambrosiozyma monospora]